MRKLTSFLVTLLATTALLAYDFKVGDIRYQITSSTNWWEHTVAVTKGVDDIFDAGSYPSLTSATIPDSVMYQGVFYKVTSISSYAFYHSKNLISITIPNSVTNIEQSAFEGCSNLVSIIIPNSLTNIGEAHLKDVQALNHLLIFQIL